MLDMQRVQMWRLGVQCSNARMILDRSLPRVDSYGIVRSRMELFAIYMCCPQSLRTIHVHVPPTGCLVDLCRACSTVCHPNPNPITATCQRRRLDKCSKGFQFMALLLTYAKPCCNAGDVSRRVSADVALGTQFLELRFLKLCSAAHRNDHTCTSAIVQTANVHTLDWLSRKDVSMETHQ